MPSDQPTTIRPRLAHATLLVPIVLGAFALRIVHLIEEWKVVLVLPPPEDMDRWLNMLVARTISEGDWLGGWAAPYDSSPGYSYLLAIVHRLTGGSWATALVVQLALGALVPVFLYDVGRRLRDEATGVVAALLGALYVPAIFYEGLLVKFSLVPVATAGLLSGVVRLRDGEPRAGVRAGVFAGLLVLLRPNAALIAVFGVAWALAVRPWRDRLRDLAWIVAGALVFLGPMAVRDTMASRHGMASALGGIHFYIGTNRLADGEYVVLPGVRPDIIGHVVDAHAEAERRTRSKMSPEEVSRFWFAEGFAFIREQPLRWAVLMLRKLWFAFSAPEGGSFGDDFDDFRQFSGVLALPAARFGTIVPLALVGLASAVRRRQLLLPAIVLGCLAGILPFFVAGRYRLMLAPPMIVAAAIGLVELDALRARHGLGRTMAAVAGLVLVAVAVGATDREVLAFVASVAACIPLVHALGAPAAHLPSSST